MSIISTSDWDDYRDAINQGSESFGQVPILWRRNTVFRSQFGEDPIGAGKQYTDTPIVALIQSNYFRTWPITKSTTTGELDKENLTLIINHQYLKDNDWLTVENYPDIKPDTDRFIIKGRPYKAEGDIDVSYANNEPVLFYIMLKRELTMTKNNVAK